MIDLVKPTRAFADRLSAGTLDQSEKIDERIRTRAEHWRIERMAIVDRNVLRLAVYEFLFEDTPHTVVINEALEIARRFSTFEATQFINGILDAIKLDLEKAKNSRPDRTRIRRRRRRRDVSNRQISMGRVYATTVSGRYGLMSAASGMLLVLALSCLSFSPRRSRKIRGYKVYKKTIIVNAATNGGPNDENRLADLKISDVGLADASLTGLTLDLSAAFRCPKQSGRVDFLTFRDFRVNGLRIEVEEYDHAFLLRKSEIKRLPQPIRVFVPVAADAGSRVAGIQRAEDRLDHHRPCLCLREIPQVRLLLQAGRPGRCFGNHQESAAFLLKTALPPKNSNIYVFAAFALKYLFAPFELQTRFNENVSEQNTNISEYLAENFGANANYVEGLLARYNADPNSVDESWRQFFGDMLAGGDGRPQRPLRHRLAASAAPAAPASVKSQPAVAVGPDTEAKPITGPSKRSSRTWSRALPFRRPLACGRFPLRFSKKTAG